jgi:hypothetical protein
LNVGIDKQRYGIRKKIRDVVRQRKIDDKMFHTRMEIFHHKKAAQKKNQMMAFKDEMVRSLKSTKINYNTFLQPYTEI